MPNPSIERLLDAVKERTISPAVARVKLEKTVATNEERASVLAAIIRIEADDTLRGVKPPRPVADKLSVIDVLPDGWIRDYVIFQQISEAPDSFHLFSALAVLSHVVGRKVFYRVGAQVIYAPISVFLVSPAGQARRSSAIGAAADIAQMAGTNLLRDVMTPEGLLYSLKSNSHALIIGDEAASILNKSAYMETMPQTLCPLLDCKTPYQKTLKSETFTIEEPTVSLLMGCAPEWIITSMPKAALGGGLFSRLLVVRETKVKRLIPRPEDEMDDKTIEESMNRIGRQLLELASAPGGRMTYSERSKKLFDDFYEENNEALEIADERMAVYLSRKHIHVHRMCMAFLVSEGKKRLEVDETTLVTVLSLLKSIEVGMSVAYSMTGLEAFGQLQQRILNRIDRGGGQVKHSELLRHLSCSSLEMQNAIATLLEADTIEVQQPRIRGHLVRLYLRKRKAREVVDADEDDKSH